MNKKKIINDPVYGFINIPNELIYDIIDHPFLQRLRRIKQLGLTDYVYPGALHTRFHHALGAMHLMKETLDNLREKGIEIDDDEYTAALLAILLHDIGHAPFSHALEQVLAPGVPHEQISSLIMEELNRQYNGALDLALKMFNSQYERKFFNQLIASQLDIDRLDYLNRDSFFTGVSEGKIGSERIIKLLTVVNNEIIVEEKGIYSIENFLSARRLMYWQVYLHKTTIGVEKMLIQLVSRMRHLIQNGAELHFSPELNSFLSGQFSEEDFKRDKNLLAAYLSLDDYDILYAVKQGLHSGDNVLKQLGEMLLERKLFKVKLQESPFNVGEITSLKEKVSAQLKVNMEEAGFFVSSGEISNAAYLIGGKKIKVLKKSGEIVDVAVASDLPNIKAMRKIVKKFYLSWPKILTL
ncbi:MAG TPA: phosphohydrolase [Cytophagales bacterium]|nr:phosphohydrolase [Cytophagales bacterium]